MIQTSPIEEAEYNSRISLNPKKVNMKFAVTVPLFLFLSLLEPVVSDATLYLAIVSTLDKAGLSSTQIQAIDSSMQADKAMLNQEITMVAKSYEQSFASYDYNTYEANNLSLRRRKLPQCNPCPGFPVGWLCWYNGVQRPACPNRKLESHQSKDESELSQMSESDRQRHLQADQMCTEATADVVAAIDADIKAGKITVPASSFSHECIYEYA